MLCESLGIRNKKQHRLRRFQFGEMISCEHGVCGRRVYSRLGNCKSRLWEFLPNQEREGSCFPWLFIRNHVNRTLRFLCDFSPYCCLQAGIFHLRFSFRWNKQNSLLYQLIVFFSINVDYATNYFIYFLKS